MGLTKLLLQEVEPTMPKSSPAQSEEEQLHPPSKRQKQSEEREATPADRQVGDFCILLVDLLYSLQISILLRSSLSQLQLDYSMPHAEHRDKCCVCICFSCLSCLKAAALLVKIADHLSVHDMFSFCWSLTRLELTKATLQVQETTSSEHSLALSEHRQLYLLHPLCLPVCTPSRPPTEYEMILRTSPDDYVASIMLDTDAAQYSETSKNEVESGEDEVMSGEIESSEEESDCDGNGAESESNSGSDSGGGEPVQPLPSEYLR